MNNKPYPTGRQFPSDFGPREAFLGDSEPTTRKCTAGHRFGLPEAAYDHTPDPVASDEALGRVGRLLLGVGLILIAGLLALLACFFLVEMIGGTSAYGQTPPPTTLPATRPAGPLVGPAPVHVFFQPARNLAMLKAMGVTHAWGPEVENKQQMAPDALRAAEDHWMKVAGEVGLKVVWKGPRAPVPPHVVGFLHRADEPNGKSIKADTLRPEFEYFRALDPNMPIYLSLAGDKVTSANLARDWELAALLAFTQYTDWVSINTYNANRNAKRYPTSWTADAVARLKKFAPDKKVLAWVEMNDQQLPPPKPADGFNRGPTPDEIRDTVRLALAAGADGIGWFATADRGQYGWGVSDPLFPVRGDSYWPLWDRNKQSIKAQLDAVAQIGAELNPPTPRPDPQVAALQLALAATEAALGQERERIRAASVDAATLAEKLAPRPPPSTRPAPPKVYVWATPPAGFGLTDAAYRVPGTIPIYGTKRWRAKPAGDADYAHLLKETRDAGYPPFAIDDGPWPGEDVDEDGIADTIDYGRRLAMAHGVDPARLRFLAYDGLLTGRLGRGRVSTLTQCAYAWSADWTVEQWNREFDKALPRMREAAGPLGLPVVPAVSPHPNTEQAGPGTPEWGAAMLRAQLDRMRREGLDCVVWIAPEKGRQSEAGRDVLKAFMEGR